MQDLRVCVALSVLQCLQRPLAVQAEGSIDIQPYVTDFPCEKKADVKHITSPDPPLKSRRTSVVLDAVGIMKERVGDDVPVIAGL